MTSPYINTILYATTVLHPSLLNNDIYINIKQTLIDRLEKKCYKDYGYIVKIFQILEKKDGLIMSEDITASVTYNIKFSCQLCNPLEDMQIISKVDKITNVFISLKSDPILVFVTFDRINSDKFYRDYKGEIKIKNGGTLTVGTLVKLTVMAKSFANGDNHIIVIGYMDDVANNNEIAQYYNNFYQNNEGNEIVNIDEYLQNQKDKQIIGNKPEADGKQLENPQIHKNEQVSENIEGKKGNRKTKRNVNIKKV